MGNNHLAIAKNIETEGWYDANKLYLDNGYTELSEAVRKAENHFNKDIELPIRLPSITFTHLLGKFEENGEFSRLEVTYLDEKFGNVRYKISILKDFPTDNSLTSATVPETIKLSDGNKVLYYKNDTKLDTFIIKKKGLQYAFFIDKASVNQITVDGVIEIINSMK